MSGVVIYAALSTTSWSPSPVSGRLTGRRDVVPYKGKWSLCAEGGLCAEGSVKGSLRSHGAVSANVLQNPLEIPRKICYNPHIT